MSQQEKWSIQREGDVAVLTLDDGKANTFTAPEFEGLLRSLDEVERTDASALLLRGREGYFSAGLNLKVLPTLPPAEVGALIRRFGEAMLKLFLFPRPVVAAVGGHALGVGAMLALAADVRLFARGPFRFGLNEVPGGLMVPTFGAELARAAVPVEYQTEVVLHGRVLEPEEVFSRRIAESLHAPEELATAARARATQLAALPTGAYAITKRVLRGAGAAIARERLDGEVERVIAAIEGRGWL